MRPSNTALQIHQKEAARLVSGSLFSLKQAGFNALCENAWQIKVRSDAVENKIELHKPNRSQNKDGKACQRKNWRNS